MKKTIWADLNDEEKKSLLRRPATAKDNDITNTVKTILQDIRKNGDQAVKDYTSCFDNVDLDDLQVPYETIHAARDNIAPDAKNAIDKAYENIYRFHEKEGLTYFSVQTMDGITCSRRVQAFETVGLYIPGGSAPLVSTTLMTGIPAKLAGCRNKILCTPAGKNGDVNPNILYAAEKCGIQQIFKIGGAQAIAAMAYGTQSIPKCDKIFGPGNAYVTEAKAQVSAGPDGAAIDMPAGPSEVLVIANETTNAAFAAADLLSQAEHDKLSQVFLICTSEDKANEIEQEIEKQIAVLPRKDIAQAAMNNSVIIVTQTLPDAFVISNTYAPEHLVLCFDTAEDYVDLVQNAGSVFVGPYACESAGDYASGTNHVLPTYGYARNYSGLGVEAFQKTITFQTITEHALDTLGDTIETLAELEGLHAHRRAVAIRRGRA